MINDLPQEFNRASEETRYQDRAGSEFIVGQPKKVGFKKIVVLGLIMIAIIAGGFYFWSQRVTEVKPEYGQIYRLVPEKISQSAAIAIHLPASIDKATAQGNVKFNPEIEGKWLTSDEESIIIFKPKEKLNLNRYYSVQLTYAQSPETTIEADFLAVEDPGIIAIFPKEGSEAPETSEITIVFNRPMVPLTTLGYLEEQDVPVEITPYTEGRFKWITTRNLQFIPKESLQRSAHYTVKIKSGLVSMDNLEVKGQEREFITRKLRYFNLSQGETIFSQPISIYFNQPVDLEKTKREITLRNDTTGKEIPFVAVYASESDEKSSGGGYGVINNLIAGIADQFSIQWPFGGEDQKVSKDANQSIIQIYPQEDRFGREKFWDFENNYSLTIRKAYPAEGDIILDEGRNTNIQVPSIIKEITAESEKTNWAGSDFFDPQGKLWVSFYEEINLDKSKITAPKLKDTGYGEKCKDKELQISKDVECEKVPDKERIYMTFKGEEIGLGERLEVNFERIVNAEGLTINKEPIGKDIVSYPKFKILSTQPANNAGGTNLTDFVFCSNSPIAAPSREDYGKYLKANLDYELTSWANSYRVDRWYSGEKCGVGKCGVGKCGVGEFRTNIRYGLMPLADYSLEFNLEDVFSQKLTHSLRFTTGQMPSYYLNFYHLQGRYNVTSPQKTTLTFAGENMEYVNLEICKLGAKDFLYYIEQKPKYYEGPGTIFNCQKIVRDRIELPERYWLKNYFKVDLGDYFGKEPIGHYILTFYHPNYIERWGEKRQLYERSYLTITNLSVAEKKIQPEYATYGAREPLTASQLQELNNLYWVTDISSLEPVSGASVSLYRKSSGEYFSLIFAGSYTTDNQGLAFTPVLYDLKGAIISKGGDSTIIPSQESRLEWVSYAFSARKIYFYTDKPIYRPSQEVFIKGIYRLGYDGNYEIYRDQKVNLKVYNSKNDEILNKYLEVNDFGTFNTKLVLEGGAPLGMYRACVQGFRCVYFNVEEYVPAPFKVEVKTDEEEYISKDTANLTIEADYYFGVPLEGGEVTYTISSQNYYFDRYSDGYFNFGTRWYYWPPQSYEEKFLLKGKTSLNTQGKAEISQLFDFQSLFKDKEDRKSKIIIIDVTVKNPQGQSVSSQKSFIVHAGQFYLGVRADKSFLSKNEKTNLRIKSVDTQGEETGVRNVSLNLYKINWIYSKRLGADGGYHYTWEEERELVKNYNFNTNGNGNHVQEIQISEEGSYEAEAWAYDRENNLVWTTYNLYVYGERAVSVRPTTDTKLEIEAAKTNLNVGEEGEIIIKSPYLEAKALIAIERGKVFDYQLKDIKGNLYKHNFIVKEEYLPNVYVSVLLVSSKPEIKFGKVEFKIDTERKELDIEVKSNKTHYLPGENVTLDILTKDYAGKPVQAEVSVAVVDLSVLALKGNPKKNPIIFFYAGFPLTVSTASNIKNILIEAEIPTKGGGGLSLEALERKKRGVFKETAFWQAVVRTGSDGKAQVKFTLPDNLTTWQTETLGLTKDTKLGVDYQEFITRKELMVVPLKPRFVVPGDIFLIGAKIFNQSEEKQKLEVEFTSKSLVLEDDKEKKKVTINPDKTDTVYFQVQAPSQIETGEHVFVLSAKSNDLEDTVEMSIDITRNNTYEVTATANYTSDETSKEYVFLPDEVVKNRGELSIKSSATLAVFLSDALNYLLKFPYGCSEQIASRLDAIAIVQRGLNLPNLADKFKLEKIKYQDREYTIEEVVELGLAELYNNQRGDGGFSYWERGESNFYLTLHVVDTLYNLSLAGFEINQNSLNRAADYLYSKITTDRQIYQNKDNVILTAYTLSKLPNFANRSILTQKVIDIANNDLFIHDQISNASLAYLANLLAKEFDPYLKNKIFAVLDNRIDIDSRGAFLETGNNVIWRYYETPIKNTALYLKAQVAVKSNNPILDKVLRWLLNSRSKDGAWGSTNNTITVIDAFTDFLQWKRETESNFTLELLINDEKEGGFEFNSETILEQFRKEVALRDLEFNKNNTILFQKTNLNDLPNNLYYDLSLKYYLPAEQIPPRDEGFSITREFYGLDDKKNENPLGEAKVGEVLRGHIQITVPASRNFAMVEDYIPAGMEIVNLELATEEKSLRLQETELKGREFTPDFEEIRDDRVFLFKENLEPGVYEFDYYVRALIPGKFNHLPAVVSEMYFPENFGRTNGGYFEIE